MPPPAKPVYSNRGGIVTTTQVECWKQRLKTEEEISKLQLVKGKIILIPENMFIS